MTAAGVGWGEHDEGRGSALGLSDESREGAKECYLSRDGTCGEVHRNQGGQPNWYYAIWHEPDGGQAEDRTMAERKTAALKQQRAIATRDALLEAAAQVFARLAYAEARLRDISEQSGISEGALYFHYGTKREIAAAVLAAQQERMTTVLTDVLESSSSGLDKLRSLAARLAELIANDVIVQGGIRLAGQPNPELVDQAREPYFEWIRIGRSLILEGIDDGSIRPETNVESAAEIVNALFVGSQMLSGLSDSWASLPRRVDTLDPYLLRLFGSGAE